MVLVFKEMEIKTMKYNSTKSLGYSKGGPKRKYIAIQDFLKKLEKSQIHKLTLNLKKLKKE